MTNLHNALDRIIPLTDATGRKLPNYYTNREKRRYVVNSLLRDELRVTGGAVRQPVFHVVDVPKARKWVKLVTKMSLVFFPLTLLASIGVKAIITGAMEIVK